jgi:hypothetical protein
LAKGNVVKIDTVLSFVSAVILQLTLGRPLRKVTYETVVFPRKRTNEKKTEESTHKYIPSPIVELHSTKSSLLGSIKKSFE